MSSSLSVSDSLPAKPKFSRTLFPRAILVGCAAYLVGVALSVGTVLLPLAAGTFWLFGLDVDQALLYLIAIMSVVGGATPIAAGYLTARTAGTYLYRNAAVVGIIGMVTPLGAFALQVPQRFSGIDTFELWIGTGQLILVVAGATIHQLTHRR